MTETLDLMLALVTGISLGAMFFGGLWWTVQKGVSSKDVSTNNLFRLPYAAGFRSSSRHGSCHGGSSPWQVPRQ